METERGSPTYGTIIVIVAPLPSVEKLQVLPKLSYVHAG